MKCYDEDGVLKTTTRLVGGVWNPDMGALKPGEMAIYEIEMEQKTGG